MLKPLLNRKEFEAKEETIEGMVFKRFKEEKVQTSMVSDKTSSIALSYEEENQRINTKEHKDLKRILEGNERELLKLEQVMETLSSPHQKVIKGIYIKRQSRRLICSQLFISENTLNRYRKKAMAEMVMIFEGYFGV